MSLQGRLSPLPTSHLALRILLSLPALAAAPIRCVRWASLSTRPLQVAAESSWPLAAIIPRGVDIVSFSADPPARAAARALAREWHLCCNATYVLHLGRLTVQKGALDFSFLHSHCIWHILVMGVQGFYFALYIGELRRYAGI